MSHDHGTEITGSLFGFLAVQLPRILGMVSLGSLAESFLLGMAGALGGLVVTRLGKWIIQKIKSNKTNKKQ